MSVADDRAAERRTMVALLRVSNPRVAAALRAVRRHAFVPADATSFAYEDEPLSLGYGDATISAPHMVALMLEEADLHDGDRVLEVGGGMGYLAAVAAELVGASGHIDTVEVDAALAREAERRLNTEGYAGRVSVHTGDGSLGLAELTPFDVIIVSCAAPSILPAWKAQVRDGGRVVVPVGDRWEQLLLTYSRSGEAGSVREGPACRFVPLRRVTTPHI
jgi:protein-L-isoaspartate(D-aspartate) O-methyltransferase